MHRAKRIFSSTRLGNVAEGQVLKDLSPEFAEHLIAQKLIEPVYATKVVKPEPVIKKKRGRPRADSRKNTAD